MRKTIILIIFLIIHITGLTQDTSFNKIDSFSELEENDSKFKLAMYKLYKYEVVHGSSNKNLTNYLNDIKNSKPELYQSYLDFRIEITLNEVIKMTNLPSDTLTSQYIGDLCLKFNIEKAKCIKYLEENIKFTNSKGSKQNSLMLIEELLNINLHNSCQNFIRP